MSIEFSTAKALDNLKSVIQAGAYDYTNESVCQEQIEMHLKKLGATFYREYTLGEFGVIDFYFPNTGIGLEVKASKNWNRTKVFRQCERYCKSEEINGLLLATARAQALPDLIEDKPARVFYLGECQL